MDKEALINGYFENSLSESQSEKLERLLKTDAEFASDFEFERELQSALKIEERQELKSIFSKLDAAEVVKAEDTVQVTSNEDAHHTFPSDKFNRDVNGIPKTTTKIISIGPWLVAASVIFLLGLSMWFLLFNSTDLNTDQLYAANFEPYDNVVHPIERGNSVTDLKTKAFTAYEEADYNLALELFKELQVQQSDPSIPFYKAIVLMQLQKYQDAIPILESYINNNGQLKDRATWYLALAHLKQGDISESTIQLKKLVEMGSFKKDAAEKLLGELR